ncbi:MAG: ABC transporter permease [Terracidiphilus sp.]|jgi:predicted permease
MQPITRFLRKLSILFGRERFHGELDEEMAFHRELTEKEFVASGMTAEAARYAAMRQFGNATRLKERSHEVVGFSSETVLQDLRFALRQLRRNPGFAATAILVLALGVGASVAIFAFVDAALIKPLPYRDPSRIVHVTEKDPAAAHVNISYLDYVDWKRLNTVLSDFDVFTGRNDLFSTPSGTEPVRDKRVSTGFFRTLGVTPVLGRDFQHGEDIAGAPGVVMLSYGAWQRRFGGKRDVVGQSVMLNGVSHTVIGVLPERFQFALGDTAEFWTALQPVEECEKKRDCHNLYGVGRLKDGVTVEAAQANMQGIARQLEIQYPVTNRQRGASVVPLSEMIVGDIRPILLVLLAGAGLLLLIACVNVSSLLLVRSESRKREIAVRGALGASRTRLRGQFAIEGLVIVAAGGSVGLLFADGAMQILSHLISKSMLANMPYFQGLGLNSHVLVFAGTLGLLACILFSVAPILHLSRSGMRDGLTEGGRTAAGTLWRRMGAHLVVIELATAMTLLSGAGLLGKSLYRLMHVELGFEADHLATVRVGLHGAKFEADDRVIAFAHRVIERVQSLPGVQSAAMTSVLPVTCDCNSDWVRIAGRPYNGIHITANERRVSAGYFTTLRARLFSGRYFTDAEDASKPKVMMINHTFAEKFFPGEDPVGKMIGDPELTPASMKQVIGVVEDFKDGGLEDAQSPTVYYPFNQNATTDFSLVVRTSQDEQTILPVLAATIHQLSADVGVEDGSTMTENINDSQTAYLHRSTAYLIGGFAGLALVLGAVGLYGVVAYSVSQRTREIGVRMALGARRSSVYQLVLGEAGKLIGMGLVIGLASSVAAAMLMRKLLFGVEAWDAGTLVAVAVVLGVSAMLASFIPARRAAGVNPTEALRAE